jgi:hypothetical protein
METIEQGSKTLACCGTAFGLEKLNDAELKYL